MIAPPMILHYGNDLFQIKDPPIESVTANVLLGGPGDLASAPAASGAEDLDCGITSQL